VVEPLSANEVIVLALIAERPAHGWAVAGKLARGGEIGSIWAISRPSVYHALERLELSGRTKTAGLERGGRGPHRVIYKATDRGRKELHAWLREPVQHVRDIRSLFLLKVVLCQRAVLDLEPLLVAQRAALLPFVDWLEAQLDDPDDEALAEATVVEFRLETTTAVVRFIDGLLDRLPAA
jgi:DNA-binding PadR family transcriptional regulator